MSLYQRSKSWYYDFQYHGERYTGCIGPVSKTVAKEILAKKKAEAVEGRYEFPHRSRAHAWRILSKTISPTTERIGVHARYYGMRPRGTQSSLSWGLSDSQKFRRLIWNATGFSANRQA